MIHLPELCKITLDSRATRSSSSLDNPKCQDMEAAATATDRSTATIHEMTSMGKEEEEEVVVERTKSTTDRPSSPF